MAPQPASPAPAPRADRSPPHSEEAEQAVLGSVLIDAARVLDICVESQLTPDSFYVPAHRALYEMLLEMSARGDVVDALTVAERLKTAGALDRVGGSAFIYRLIDSTPTSAHAEYYIDIVRQKHLLRSVLACVRDIEGECFQSPEPADHVLSTAEQRLLSISEGQHGTMVPWETAVKESFEQIENVLNGSRILSGIPTGFKNLDEVMLGLRAGEMVVLAARPSMGKTSLAMNVAENVALGRGGDHAARPVGIFSLEMSRESLVCRMLCSHANVSMFKLAKGYVSTTNHGKLAAAASVLSKALICLDDTGGLDIMELRARARRMRKRYNVELIVVDYLQMLRARDAAAQGRQQETATISMHLKAMAKELHVPVLVLSQLSRAPEQRDKTGRPKLSDLRDSGAIEQDADVVCLLRRPKLYPEDDEHEDVTLAIVDVAKHRNGPTGEVRLNFDEEFTRFHDRAMGGQNPPPGGGALPAGAPAEEPVQEQMGMEAP